MLDGKLIKDSIPLEEVEEYEVKFEEEKPSMSFTTAFMLSFKNYRRNLENKLFL